MEFEIIDFREIPVFIKGEGYKRAKEATFLVNGSKHTLQISMADYDAGRSNQLIKKEAEKITAAYKGLNK